MLFIGSTILVVMVCDLRLSTNFLLLGSLRDLLNFGVMASRLPLVFSTVLLLQKYHPSPDISSTGNPQGVVG
jgi:hypothetical protein